MWRVVFLLAVTGCSQTKPSSSDASTSYTRGCIEPVRRTCSSLAVVAPRTTSSLASAWIPSGAMRRLGGIDGYVYSGSVQHWVVDGSPPRLRATSDFAVDPSAMYMASDGEFLFACGAHDDLLAWDRTNTLVARVPYEMDSNVSGCNVAAYRGLAMSQRAKGSMPQNVVYDATGREVHRYDVKGFTSNIASYGCGFTSMAEDYVGNMARWRVDFIPMDGRPPSSAYGGSWPATPWPYDSRSVILVRAISCQETQATILRDDGTSTERTYPATCSGQFSVIGMSWGAVAYFGYGIFQLLDPDGALVGEKLDLLHRAASMGVIATDDYLIGMETEVRDGGAQVSYQTTIGCAQ